MEKKRKKFSEVDKQLLIIIIGKNLKFLHKCKKSNTLQDKICHEILDYFISEKPNVKLENVDKEESGQKDEREDVVSENKNVKTENFAFVFQIVSSNIEPGNYELIENGVENCDISFHLPDTSDFGSDVDEDSNANEHFIMGVENRADDNKDAFDSKDEIPLAQLFAKKKVQTVKKLFKCVARDNGIMLCSQQISTYMNFTTPNILEIKQKAEIQATKDRKMLTRKVKRKLFPPVDESDDSVEDLFKDVDDDESDVSCLYCNDLFSKSLSKEL
ncbi:hypothetical protein FQA39_LY09457 [Lamprigera yunnana]|nr:hypothetical protein FQA39_LY09457 [Lamprigera yunnana]